MKNRIIYIFLLFLLFSCKTTDVNSNISEEYIKNKEDIIVEEVISEVIPEPTKEEIETQKVDDYIENMTLEEKIGQLFIFHIHGNVKMNKNLTDFLTKYQPGGVILFSDNINDNQQISTLISDIQKTGTTRLFIGVDEEGGIVSRLGKEKNVDVTHLPPALSVGNKNNPELAYNSGKILGRELTALGFNMDMAPVADVNTNPNNPVIGNRTYSADPHIAGEMVASIVRGFQEENLISVLKHFPGHGDTNTDTHLGTVISPHSRERLDQIEFIPFKAGITAGADAIMTAHMTMPGISTTPLPATLNREIITGILREELKFNGIIMTDALDMGAISQNFSSGEATILALKAGVDILLMPYNQIAAYEALLNSVIDGKISERRIYDSLFRIISLKSKRGLLDKLENDETIDMVKSDPEHQALIKTIFNK